jgi:CHASE2 domain-containing sensor protein
LVGQKKKIEKAPLMDQEEIIFGYIPALISAVIIVCSFLLFFRNRKSLLNLMLFVFISISNGIAQSFIIPMLKGAYPSLIPHLLVIVSIPLFISQYKLYKKHRQC